MANQFTYKGKTYRRIKTGVDGLCEGCAFRKFNQCNYPNGAYECITEDNYDTIWVEE